jgi:hypothetical protein
MVTVKVYNLWRSYRVQPGLLDRSEKEAHLSLDPPQMKEAQPKAYGKRPKVLGLLTHGE